VSSTIPNIGACIHHVLRLQEERSAAPTAIVSRAGTGITYFYCEQPDVSKIREALAKFAESVVVEYSPVAVDAWGPTTTNFRLMADIKRALDPNCILNPGVFVGGL